MNLKRVEQIVEQILKEEPSTREDDYILTTEYYSRICPEVLDMPFRYVFLGHKTLNLPNFKTIERARRKIQARLPELTSKKCKEKRKKLENEYKNYYINWEDKNELQ